MPLASDDLKGEESSVHKLFGVTDDRFRAPEFQRHYVWGVEGENNQITRFWEDFKRLIEEDDEDAQSSSASSLFLGAIVLQVLDPGQPGVGVLYSVIDGQQRILTLYMILLAIAEAFQDAGDDENAKFMSTEYLLTRTPRLKHYPRVEPTVSDRGTMAYVMSCLKNPEVVKSEWRTRDAGAPQLLKAWEAIRTAVRTRCKSAVGPQEIDLETLERLRDNILHRLEVVTITLGSRHDPHEVYERLNTRGRRLSEIDLARNAVFWTAGGDSDTARRIYDNHWDRFESQLGDRQDEYWFPYAMIREPSTTRARSYRALMSYWRGKLTNNQRGEQEAQKIVADLEEYLDGFRAITGLSDNADGRIKPDVWDAITRLKQMDAPPVMYPFLMQLVENYHREEVSGEDVISAIGVIDSFLIRRMFCDYGTTGIHAVFKSLWGNVRGGLGRMVEEIEERRLQFPDDEAFEQGVREFPLYRVRGSRRRYVLSEYERSFAIGDKPDPLPDDVTADHLLPQSADLNLKLWGVSQDDYDRLIHTWANLVPMSAAGGAAKGAKTWKEQYEMFVANQGTVYKSTRDVFDTWPKKWDASTIEKRADRLAKWALKRWPKAWKAP